MASLLLRRMAMADTPFGRAARAARRFVLDFSLPAPAVVVRPLLWVFLAVRQVYYFVYRVFVCEPLFKAACTRVGRRVRTGPFIQWIQGAGRIEIGDDLAIHGKISIIFASRYSDEPTLRIGSHSNIGHNCAFVVGRAITIGEYCQMASAVTIFDASGHPSDPIAREAGEPAPIETVKPVVIERNVWIGTGAVIFPGVTIGENSVIGTRAIVMNSVPPNSLVLAPAGRRMGSVGTVAAGPAPADPAGVAAAGSVAVAV
ncbi:MAG TPA: acyltransferase [Gemmatirosa sp.]